MRGYECIAATPQGERASGQVKGKREKVKVRIRKTLLFFLVILVLHGCAGIYSVVEFEVLEPATVTLPEGDGHLLVINRAPVTRQSFDENDLVGVEDKHLIILDSMITNNINRGVLEVLSQSPIERYRTPLWLSERRFDTTGLDDLILTRREVADLCETWGSDVIISLEKYSMDVDDSSIYYTDDPSILHSHYHEVSARVHWKIYIPGSPKPFDSYSTIDTLFFTDYMNGELQYVPSPADRIRMLMHEAGMKYGRYLVPMWTEASRLLFRGKHDSLKLAADFTDEGDWDNAFGIWKELSQSDDSTVVARSFHNMAIYYELEDQLDSASYMVDLAAGFDTTSTIHLYKDELDTRIQNRKEVLKQVGAD